MSLPKLCDLFLAQDGRHGEWRLKSPRHVHPVICSTRGGRGFSHPAPAPSTHVPPRGLSRRFSLKPAQPQRLLPSLILSLDSQLVASRITFLTDARDLSKCRRNMSLPSSPHGVPGRPAPLLYFRALCKRCCLDKVGSEALREAELAGLVTGI